MNVAELALRFHIAGELYSYCVIHVQKSDGADPFDEDDLTALAGAVESWWVVGRGAIAPMTEVYTPDTVLERVRCKVVEPGAGAVADVVISVSGSAESGDFEAFGVGFSQTCWMFPPQCAWCVTLHTAVTGSRSHRGRLYLPATLIARRSTFAVVEMMNDEDIARGYVDDEMVQMLRDKIACLGLCISDAAPEGEPWALCVYSRKLRTSQSVSRYELSRYLRTQRDRANPNGLWAQIDLTGALTGTRAGTPVVEE